MPAAKAESPALQTPTTGSNGNGESIDGGDSKRKLPLEDAEGSPATPQNPGGKNKHQKVDTLLSIKDERPRPTTSWAQNLARMLEGGIDPPRTASKPVSKTPRASTPPSPYHEVPYAHDPRSESSSPSPRHSRQPDYDGDADTGMDSPMDQSGGRETETGGPPSPSRHANNDDRPASASSGPNAKEGSTKASSASASKVKVILRKSASGQAQPKANSTETGVQDPGSQDGDGPDAAAPASSSGAAQPEQPQSSTPMAVQSHHTNHKCSRAPLAECSEEEFKADLKTVWDEVSKAKKKSFAKSKNEDGKLEYSNPVLNGKPLDFFSLYKEVACRGGFYNCDGINWTGQVFTRMSNFSTGHHQTGVGNALKKHYTKYLIDYEMAHPDDVIPDDKCIECGCVESSTTSKVDWICCAQCSGWVHYQCDKRTSIYSFRDYAYNGVDYVCSKCSPSAPKRNTPAK
uniref:ARID domain-containing protein n=1 Tax=Pyramimonas obovata TaxID=1411642 RepID=A0A7S0MUW2_9CHLO|mmetsp:Transcript_13999/g.29911  ORF Transcript_13999/g.29911 Transcript_13999/m.29911 type:complete len:459 (+) Transcript_13999:371-1747(+)|eukprot:CAMPEP_0118934098 /NCGR_PEP_ID=MMETSP1169-20130426/13635_1 /TAXON_ID=36882 /ORGANISM="Pyramimonas obovata, Strain CCMP722" /LENGTH=458 /DNA_ID=CAMNT_0006876963 /DNA_START=370 /DNA_END=1746 /DNA_ORIENTATION=-